ncbi:hypothetical protein DDB_G0291592 [Dictyostelium discoideum AX4]|uniref:FNIP repeat-containing protein n=1 Tax=Dictyostelium discoideum TaxID=44689 RepID=Q54EB8_DICDI|nr:hypothetical protein DDB_G0291592 [Dictyostelium discoideum AX4]EAL61780.1 hypothetical protein DDB_G0291592 [Dictyostelium discoideum AX4]|eukprot:XP_635322.1 hypothetical protein DDB_G0291592 [Dictyostelium discoideum AX4]
MNINSSSNVEEYQLIYKLYKLVFSNIVLSRLIFDYAALYEKNDYVEFYSINMLRNYPEREYIRSLYYCDEDHILEIGDLPIGGVLKLASIGHRETLIKGDTIPYGVEKLRYNYEEHNSTETPFQTLPTTLHTIKNAKVDCKKSQTNLIPPNITSLKFCGSPSISDINRDGDGRDGRDGRDGGGGGDGDGDGGGYIKIPNTIKHLEFHKNWDNDGKVLGKGDIPEGVTCLDLGLYKLEFNQGVLPESLTKLMIRSYDETNDKNNQILDDNFPKNIKDVTIFKCKLNISPSLNLFKLSSIKILHIILDSKFKIEANSLPSSLTNLKISTYQKSFTENVFPNGLLSLSINQIIEQEGVLPESLTNLNLSDCNITIKQDNLNKMISILPASINSLILPSRFKNLKINNIKSPTINLKYY